MNRKVLAVAVAAAFTAPVAFAQTSVTIGGTVNIVWDYVKASGATGGGADTKTHDRVRDGAGSNIRFFVNEELGGGNSAFVQVESAVIQNSDQRNNAAGGTLFNSASGNAAPVWGNRNSAIGIRSKAAGRFLIGVWDLHYDETYKIDPGWLTMNSSSSILGLMNTFGIGASTNAATAAVPGMSIGARYSNVIRWDSPVWGGFSITAGYARPTDGAPVNSSGDVGDGKKNRAYNLAPRWEGGGFAVQYSYLQDKDIRATAATISVASVTLAGSLTGNYKVTSNRIGVRYRFGMGLGIGVMYDDSKLEGTSVQTGGLGTGLPVSNEIKRQVWSIPITFDTGNHSISGSYSWADSWEGNVANGAPVTIGTETGINLNAETGAQMWTIGYAYKLSKRTNVHVSWQQIKNDKAARYDFFANSSGVTALGADPQSFALGLRHTW